MPCATLSMHKTCHDSHKATEIERKGRWVGSVKVKNGGGRLARIKKTGVDTYPVHERLCYNYITI